MGSNRTFLSLPPRRGSRRSSSFTCSFRQRKSLHSSSTSIYTRQSMDQVRFYLPCSSSHFSLPHTHLCVSPRSFSFCRRFLSRCLQSGHLSLSPYSSLCFRQRSPSALNSPSLSSSSAVQVYPPPSLAQTDGSSSFSSSLSREYGTSFHTCPSFSFSPSFSSPCSSSARSRSEVCVSTGTSPAALGHSPHISLLLSSLSSLSPLSSSSSPFSSSSSASRYRVYSDWSVWYVPVTSASFHRKPLELLRVPGNPLAFHASSSSSPSSSPPSTSSSLSSSERCVPSLPESGALKKDEERQEERQEEREEKEKEKEEEVEGISPVSSLSVGRSHGVLAVDGKVFALGLEYTKGQMGLSPSSPLFRSSLSSFKHKTSFSSTLLSFFSSLLPSSFFSSPLGTSSSLSRERMMPPRLVPVDPPEGGWKGKVVKVACGATHTCAITDLGCMYTWGSPNGWFNGSPLGLGDTKPRFRPTLVQDFVKREESVVDVACGMDWTLCATHRGDLYVSGASEFGVQGRGPAEGSSSTSKFFPISFFKTLHPSTSSPPFTTQDLEDRDNDDDDYTNKENREKTTPTSSQHLHPRQQGDFDLHSFPSSSFCFSSPLDRGKLGGVRDEEEEKEKGFDGRNLEKVSQLLLEKRKDARYVDETPSSSSSSSFLSRQEEMSRHLRYFSPRKEEEERAGSCRSWRDSSSERKEFSSLNKEEREKLLAGRRRSREGDSHIRNGMMDYPERTRRRGDDGKKRKEEEEKDKENSIMEKSYVPHEFYSPIRTPTVDYVDSKEEEKKRERKRERFRFLDLSCGRRHCVVVTQDGRVWTWGCNLNGELGRNVGE
ncbi:regulator of chromosome condensation repeat-containing protein, partial [Cystoisospora suis]